MGGGDSRRLGREARTRESRENPERECESVKECEKRREKKKKRNNKQEKKKKSERRKWSDGDSSLLVWPSIVADGGDPGSH